MEDGLPVSQVNVVHQDNQGFIWFGTNGGLVKYDGYEFSTFTHEQEDPFSILDNTVRTIIESMHADGHYLWLGLRHGFSKFDLESEKFYNYLWEPHTSDKTKRVKNGNTFSICETADGAIWVGTARGIERIDYKTKHIEHLLGDETIRALYADTENNLWVGTSVNGLVRIDLATGEQTRFQHDPANGESLSSDKIRSIYEAESLGPDLLLVGTVDGLNKFDKRTGKCIPFPSDLNNPISLEKIMVLDMIEPKHSGRRQLWMTGDVLRKMDLETDEYTQFEHHPDARHGISSSSTNSIFEDNSGNIWIASTEGVDIYDPLRKPFTNYVHREGDPTSLSSNHITMVHETNQKDVFWIGANNGLMLFDRTDGVTDYLPTPVPIYSIHEDRSDNVWLGTGGGIYTYFPETKKYKLWFDSQATTCRDIFEDRWGELWFATTWGLDNYDPVQDQHTKYLHRTKVTSILQSNQDENYLLLGGVSFGLVKMHRETGYFLDYMHHIPSPGSLSNNYAYTIHQMESGELYLGTGDGLDLVTEVHEKPPIVKSYRFALHPGGDTLTHQMDSLGDGINSNSIQMHEEGPWLKFQHLKKADGLPSDHIVSFLQDDHEKFWLGTLNGLSHFDPETRTIRNYYKSDGLPGNQFTPRSCLKTEEGELFFGTVNGLTSFFPDSLKNNTFIPPVVLTDFQVFHKQVPIENDPSTDQVGGPFLPKHISKLDTLELTHRENVFSFEFAALDFHNPMKNEYAYRMEGFEDEWIYTNASNRIAAYTNLDPGEYLFRVIGSNNDGIWNQEGLSLTVIIHPPWWQTMAAYVVYLLALTGLIIVIWRFQLSKIKLKHQVEIEHLSAEHYLELDEHKSRFMANISHEFRTPLTLILGPVSNLLTQIKDHDMKADLELIQRQARRLLELVVQLLDISKLENDKMILQASQQNIVPLLKGLVLSFSSLAERNGIDLKFETRDDNIQLFVERDAMVKIFNNLLSNAFKFSEAGNTVTVSVHQNEDSTLGKEGEIIIRVADTGIGIPENHLSKIFDRFHQVDNTETRQWGGTGIGLSLTKELVELHGGSISVDSNLEVGTVFTIRLPRGKGHLQAHEIVQSTQYTEENHSGHNVEGETKDSQILANVTKSDAKPIVLIVEDNFDVRNYVRSYLDKDYQCCEAVDGQDGLNQVREIIPDLVISDVMMPKLNGLELCHHIKTDGRTSHIPVLMLTAKADLGSKVKGLETGADAYLTKPFEAMELKIRVKNLIDQRQALREKFQKEFNLIPDSMNISSMDKRFLESVVQIISDRMDDTGFNVDNFSREVFMSRQQLNRKLKALTGRTAVEFIRLIRLKRAALLLGNNHASITEIAYQVGFSNPSHFSRSFHEEFGKTPSAFISEQDELAKK